MPLPIVKFGLSKRGNILQRMKSHRTSMPFGVTILCIVRVKDFHKAESFALRKFDKWSLINTPVFKPQHKGEWYWFTPEMWLWIHAIDDYQLRIKLQDKLTTR